MVDAEKNWLRELELRFGVRGEFARRLLPLLRVLAAGNPSEAEWSDMLLCVADAYCATLPNAGADTPAPPSVDEMLRLFSQFSAELRKMDESLKVLSACLSRARTQVRRPAPRDPIH
jgi:hypothetical protein